MTKLRYGWFPGVGIIVLTQGLTILPQWQPKREKEARQRNGLEK